MALHDEVLSDIRARIIPRRFKVRHLMSRPDPNQQGRYLVGNRSYSERSLKVIPANHSISEDGVEMGDYVRRGRAPGFIRLGQGRYRLA